MHSSSHHRLPPPSTNHPSSPPVASQSPARHRYSKPPAPGPIQHRLQPPSLADPAPPSYLPTPGFTGPLQLNSLLDPPAHSRVLSGPQESPTAIVGSDSGTAYPSPTNGVLGRPTVPGAPNEDGLAIDVMNGAGRSPFSTTTGSEGPIPELQHGNSLYRAPSPNCRYRFLDPVLPYLKDIIPASVAADLLDVYLTEPGSSLFRCASPYILTRVFRKRSVLHPTHPRITTPALLATILWCAAQTADIILLHVPGSRSRITNALYNLATFLISERDPDRWRRIHGT